MKRKNADAGPDAERIAQDATEAGVPMSVPPGAHGPVTCRHPWHKYPIKDKPCSGCGAVWRSKVGEFEQVKAMFERAGIVFEVVGCKSSDGATGTAIMWEALTGEHNNGYQGSVALMYFDDDGALVEVETGEV
jgi:hypothetical protein